MPDDREALSSKEPALIERTMFWTLGNTAVFSSLRTKFRSNVSK